MHSLSSPLRPEFPPGPLCALNSNLLSTTYFFPLLPCLKIRGCAWWPTLAGSVRDTLVKIMPLTLLSFVTLENLLWLRSAVIFSTLGPGRIQVGSLGHEHSSTQEMCFSGSSGLYSETVQGEPSVMNLGVRWWGEERNCVIPSFQMTAVKT